MDFVTVQANQGKEYVITVANGEAIKVSSLVRTSNSIGKTTYSRKIWEKGDGRLSLTAHCALNAWRRSATLKCSQGAELWRIK